MARNELMLHRRLLLLAALALSGCATAGVRVSAPPGAGFSELEPVYRADAGREALTISVASNGCTQKATSPSMSSGRARG